MTSGVCVSPCALLYALTNSSPSMPSFVPCVIEDHQIVFLFAAPNERCIGRRERLNLHVADARKNVAYAFWLVSLTSMIATTISILLPMQNPGDIGNCPTKLSKRGATTGRLFSNGDADSWCGPIECFSSKTVRSGYHDSLASPCIDGPRTTRLSTRRTIWNVNNGPNRT